MNYIRNVSKSSLKSCSSKQRLTADEEVSKLQSEIEFLKDKVVSLELSLESKDSSIGKLVREKEKMFVELKSVQETSRYLQQQLIDERDMHSKEKEYFKQEIQRSKTKNYCDIDSNEADMLREEIKSRDEVIFNICTKYLKIKTNKNALQKKLHGLQKKTEKAYRNIINLLEENRKSLNDLLNKMINGASTIGNSKRYLKLLKSSANLHYENIELQIELTYKENGYGNPYMYLLPEKPTTFCVESNFDKRVFPNKYDITNENLSIFSQSYLPKTIVNEKIETTSSIQKNLLKPPFQLLNFNKRTYSDPCIIRSLTDF